jgi:hypothetical protein
MGAMRYTYRILAGKGEGMNPLGRPGRRWPDNKIDLTQTGVRGIYKVVVNAVMNVRFTENAAYFLLAEKISASQ